ncbi:helix-turn-helix domain-containing protein [Nocardia cyriacigeorgica]|uniref:helix-turn-helix domain-containing protein n=1 Tax=Nocardia cyriacigeorgica TaxID=135487 RepID=UPI0013BB5101|nr:helix-turn-helix domain-containing protein [Nocardia cyriacigeorgica]NEW49031.1 helix-turn-helix domain-containing protein [Nocardia cyriacigeorgica]
MTESTGGSATSPPTDRVVGIIELLASLDSPATSADIADTLGLSRSTAGAILTSLREHGWVSRLPDLRYTAGPALIAAADKVRDGFSAPSGMAGHLEALAARVGCGAAMSLVEADQLTFIAVTRGIGHIPAGVEVGLRLPLQAPAGATVVALSDSTVQRQWLAATAPGRREGLAAALDQIADTGFAAWGADAADLHRIDVLGRVVAHLSTNASNQPLREEVHALMGETGGHLYTTDTWHSERDLPVSYMAAAVHDRAGKPLWEIQISPLRTSVSLAERHRYVEELSATARALSDWSPHSGHAR